MKRSVRTFHIAAESEITKEVSLDSIPPGWLIVSIEMAEPAKKGGQRPMYLVHCVRTVSK